MPNHELQNAALHTRASAVDRMRIRTKQASLRQEATTVLHISPIKATMVETTVPKLRSQTPQRGNMRPVGLSNKMHKLQRVRPRHLPVPPIGLANRERKLGKRPAIPTFGDAAHQVPNITRHTEYPRPASDATSSTSASTRN